MPDEQLAENNPSLKSLPSRIDLVIACPFPYSSNGVTVTDISDPVYPLCAVFYPFRDTHRSSPRGPRTSR
jgi:hypothetical protein